MLSNRDGSLRVRNNLINLRTPLPRRYSAEIEASFGGHDALVYKPGPLNP